MKVIMMLMVTKAPFVTEVNNSFQSFTPVTKAMYTSAADASIHLWRERGTYMYIHM